MSADLEINVIATFKNEMEAEFNRLRNQLEELKNKEKELTTAQKDANMEAVKSTQGLKSWASSMPRILTSVTGLTTAVLNSVRSYRDLANTATDLDRAELGVNKALEARDKAQRKVTMLEEKGKTGTEKYRGAVLDLAQANDNLKIKTDAFHETQQKVNDTYQDFYLSLLPTGLGVLSSVGTILQEVSKHQAAHAAALKAAGLEAVPLTGGMKALSLAMRAVPLVAFAAALLAIKTNAGGFRDMLNEIGKKIGEMIPELKPLLQWIKDVAEAFGLTEKKMDLSHAFQLLKDGFNGALEAIKAIDWGAAVTAIGTAIETGMNNWNWDDAWKAFKDAIASTSAWLGPVMTSIGKFILDFIIAEGPKWWKGFQEALGATGTWVGIQIAKLGGYIVTEITKLATTWWTGFIDGLGDPKTLVLLSSPIGLIGTTIAKEIIKVGPGWWEGFRVGLAKEITWIAGQITAIGTGIAKAIIKDGPTWWEGFRVGLGKSVEWVGQQMANIGNAILKFDWAAIGSGIWTKISQGITGALGSLGKGATDLGTEIQKRLGIIPTAFEGGGGSTRNKKVDETGALVEQAKGGAGGLGGSLGIAELFAKEMQMALQFVTNGTAQISAQFLTMKTSITATMTQLQTAIGAFASTALSTVVTAVGTQTTTISAHFVTMKTSVTGTLTQLQASLTTFTSSISTISSSVGTQTTTISAHFVTMKTSIASTITAVQASVSQLSTGIAAQATAIAQRTTAISGSFLAMSQSVTSSTKTVQSATSTMSSTIASHMSSMSSHVQSFASSFSSSMSSVASQASKARSAVTQLASAINSLKSKSITVHVGLSGPGVGYLQHGGSFISGLNPRAHPGGQHGFAGMVNTPTTFRGVRMGESFKPELVTVTPLTRGTGNHSGPTVSSSGIGGNTTPVINVTVVLDGRVIQRFVEKTALAGIGVQI